MINPTPEQKSIINSIPKYDRIKIYALAGTGKTTTLSLVTKHYPEYKFLYLAFNKAIVEDGKKNFGKNTEVRTVHSLAFQYEGFKYKERLTTIDYYSLYSYLISQKFLSLDIYFEDFLFYYKYFIRFCQYRYPLYNVNEYIENYVYANNTFLTGLADFIPRYFTLLETDQNIPIIHDYYLKKFYFNFDNYSELKNRYDVVLLDEAQDTNDITLAIFEKFDAKKVMVGDVHQKIYGFRGAINGMESFQADKKFYLTYTFRFSNNKQVELANELLKYCKKENNVIKPFFKEEDIKEVKTACIITRTNAELVKMFTLKKMQDKLKPVREPYQFFSKFFDVFDRKLNIEGDKLGITFQEYLDKLEVLAGQVEDVELNSTISIIRKYPNKDFFSNLYQIAKMNYKRKNLPISIGTAHSTKGLEFDIVILTEDFPTIEELLKMVKEKYIEIMKNNRNIKEVSKKKFLVPKEELGNIFLKTYNYKLIEELNLLYVAYTRAKKELEVEEKYFLKNSYLV